MKVALLMLNAPLRNGLARAVDRAPDVWCVANYDCRETALQLLAADRPELLIIDDAGMESEALTLVRSAKTVLPALRVLLLTADTSRSWVVNAIRTGADGCVLRDGGIIGAMRAVRDVVAGGSPLNPRLARQLIGTLREGACPEVLHPRLTARQREVFDHLLAGSSNKATARVLGLTEGTVKQHVYAIYRKLGVKTRVEAVQVYLGSRKRSG